MKTYWDRSGATRCARQQARERAPGDENQKARRPPGQKFHSRKKFSLSIGGKKVKEEEKEEEREEERKKASLKSPQQSVDFTSSGNLTGGQSSVPFPSIAFRSLPLHSVRFRAAMMRYKWSAWRPTAKQL